MPAKDPERDQDLANHVKQTDHALSVICLFIPELAVEDIILYDNQPHRRGCQDPRWIY